MTDIIIVSITGLVGGFIGAQVGGGGLITLPVLLFLGLNPIVAVATNRFSALFLNLSATLNYLKNKKIDLKAVLPFTIVSLIGSAIGVKIILSIDPQLLEKIIAGMLILLMLVVFYKKEIGMFEREIHISKKSLLGFLFVAFLLGIYGGSIGIASTTFLLLLFILQGKSFISGMAYSLFITTLISAFATLIFMLNGVILYSLAIPQAISVSIGAWIGSSFAIKKGNQWVKRLFIVIVTLTIIKLFADVYF